MRKNHLSMRTVFIRSIILLLSLILLGEKAFSQDYLIAQWKDSLERAENSQDRENFLYKLARHQQHSKPPEALNYAKEGMALASLSGNHAHAIELANTCGVIYRTWGEHDLAVQWHQKALSIEKQNLNRSTPIPVTQYLLSLALKDQGKLGLALNHQLTALSGYQKKENWKMVARCYNNAGNIYRHMGDFHHAMTMHEEGLKIRKEHTPQSIGVAYHGIGEVYQAMQQHEEAAQFFRTALAAKQQYKQKTQLLETTYFSLGATLIDLEQYEEGLKYLYTALDLAEKKERRGLEIEIKRLIGLAKIGQQYHAQAHDYLTEALRMSHEAGDEAQYGKIAIHLGRNLILRGKHQEGTDSLFKGLAILQTGESIQDQLEAYEEIKTAFVAQDKPAEALYWQEKYQLLKDSLFKTQTQQQLAAQLAQLGYDQKTRDLEALKKEQEQNRLEQLVLSLVLLSAVMGLGSIFMVYYTRQQKHTHKLQQRHFQQIEATNHALRNVNLEMEQFLYILSHDLKQPIRNIGGHVSLLRRRYWKNLNEDGKTFVEFALGGVKELNQLLNDLSNYAQVGIREPLETPIRLNQVVKKAVKKLKPKIEATQAVINIGPLPTLKVDSACMYELFYHLIENAIKFRKEGQPPQIEIGYLWEDGRFQFWVKDNGIGIAHTHQPHIFQLFQRLFPADYPEGTGVGLAICRKVVHLHEGEIWLDSKPGQGSTFYFRLPDPNWNAELSFDSFSGARWFSDSNF
jgi:signal transduction histidine kinase